MSDKKSSTRSQPSSDAANRVRLQRALAAAGFGSRRQCEELILEGRVVVDGQVVEQLGLTIDPSTSKVYVDGTPLKSRRLVYYIVNKPTGVVTTNSDPEGRPRVIDLVPPGERVFPVGRLDRSSEGLILLTNDGELAQRLAHPKYEVQKIYRVTVAGNVQPETLRQMHQGIYIAEGLVKVEGARVLKARSRATEMEITLREGKNREIRRILARLGHKVQTLKRIAIGTLRLGEMPTGAYRRLTVEEIRKLKSSVEGSSSSDDQAVGKRGKTSRPGKSAPARTPTRSPRPSVAGGDKTVSRTRPAAKPKGATGRPVATAAAKSRNQPLVQLPGIARRRSGIVIGGESASASDAQATLPTDLNHELPKSVSRATGKRPAKKRSPGGRGKKRG